MELEAIGRNHAGDDQINWVTAIFMFLFHAGAVAALFFFSWKAFFVACFLWWVAGSLGIGMGYHRLLTHRGYKTPKWVEYFLTICATLALEGGPIFWVATHRLHHKYTDKAGDPHSPVDGGCWAHMGWIMSGEGLHIQDQTCCLTCPISQRQVSHVAQQWHWVPMTVLGLILLAIGGLKFVFWGIFLRTVFVLHAPGW